MLRDLCGAYAERDAVLIRLGKSPIAAQRLGHVLSAPHSRMSSKPTYRFSTTKIGNWTIEPTGSENRCILKLTKAGAEPRKVDEFGSPEAAAAAVARIETSEFAPDSHWRAKEEFDLHNWSLDVEPAKKPMGTPHPPTAIGRLSSAIKRLGGRNHFT